jgi:hypothetical protein
MLAETRPRRRQRRRSPCHEVSSFTTEVTEATEPDRKKGLGSCPVRTPFLPTSVFSVLSVVNS